MTLNLERSIRKSGHMKNLGECDNYETCNDKIYL